MLFDNQLQKKEAFRNLELKNCFQNFADKNPFHIVFLPETIYSV